MIQHNVKILFFYSILLSLKCKGKCDELFHEKSLIYDEVASNLQSISKQITIDCWKQIKQLA